MEKENTKNKTALKENNPTYVIQDLTLVAPNRNRKDILDLKESVILAESVYYPNRVKLYDLYHDITTMDGFLRGIMQKRIDNVLNKCIKFIDKSGKENEDLTELITSTVGRDLITKIIESKFWGVSGVEFVVGDNLQFSEIPRKHIKPEKGIISKSQYSIGEVTNFVIDELPFVWIIGEKKDLGLLLACSMYALYKRGNFGDWAQYVEIFGQPVRIIYYDAYDTKTRGELKTLLDQSGSSLAMMIPKQAEFEMMDGKTSNGDGKLQGTFKDACNEEMAIAILGNTETTSSSKSSGYAQSKEHGEQQNEITKSDMAFVVNMLNSDKFKTILKSYGYAVEGKFKYDKELNVDHLKTRMEVDTFVSTKVPVGDDYWYETYGIPRPDNYEELKAKMEAEKEEAEQEPNPDATQNPKTKKEVKQKSGLLETKKTNLFNLMMKSLADFFDQAQH